MTTANSSRIFALAILLLLSAVDVTAQTSATDGKTPSGLTPGAPAGTYPLTDIENINLFNGNLNFALPLLKVGGRGKAQYTMMLPIEQHWRTFSGAFDLGGGNLLYYSAPEANWWTGLKPGYGPGVVQARQVADGPLTCAGTEFYSTGMTRLTFTAPDATEYELVDLSYGGRPLQAPGCYLATTTRGKVFVSNTGAGLTFISDFNITEFNNAPGPIIWGASGYLKFPDGTTYRVDGGLVSSIRDANGNTLTFSYGTNPTEPLTYQRVTSVTDALKRQISISYADNVSVFYDQINFKGFNNASRTIKVWYSTLGNRLRTTQQSDATTPWTSSQLFPELSPNDQPYNPTVVSSLELPNTKTYEFYYNQYSELARVVLPTGGAYEYDHTPTSGVICQGLCEGSAQIYRRTTEKRSYPDGSTLEGKIKFTAESIAPNSKVTVDNLAPNNTLLGRAKHYFYGDAGPSFFLPSLYLPPWRESREYTTEHLSVDGVTVLTRTNQTWKQRADVTWWPLSWQGHSQDDAPVNDPRLVETITTLVDTNQVSKVTSINPQNPQEIGFDQFNNPTDVWSFDYGPGAVGNLLRHVHTNYLTVHPTNGVDYTDRITVASPHMLSLPVDVMTFDGNGIKRAHTKFEYDNYTADSFHALLKDWPAITGHPISSLDPVYTASYTRRGNATAVTRFLLNDQGNSTGSISEYTQYDLAGNVVKTIDPRSTSTNIIAITTDFTDRFGSPDGEARDNSDPSELNGSPSQYSYAFPTLVTNPLGHTVYSQYDFYVGRPVDVEDANGIVSSNYFIDSLDRPSRVIRAVNGGVNIKRQTTFNYDDGNRLITTTADKDGFDDNVLKSQVVYDGLGRTKETRNYEDTTRYIAVQTQYDALGQAFKTSNPFRPLAPDNETPIWTTTIRDSLGRVTSVTTPDTAVVRTAYDGARVLATDQANKQRISQSDALGRLTDIWEIVSADTQDPAWVAVAFPNHSEVTAGYLTHYAYDTLDNLTTVTQRIGTSGTLQTRTFAYDSLKRLTSTNNPEKGTISYQYDEVGNLLVKSDGRGVSAHLAYDALNRIRRRWYNASSDVLSTLNNSPQLPSSVAQTDEANFYYDADTLPYEPQNFSRGASIGLPVAVTYGGTSSTTGDYYGYDTIGRNTLKVQRLGTKDYQLTTNYNRADLPISVGYPSGNSVNYSYDSAGRPSSFTGTLGGASRSYATEATFSPFGALTKEKFGTTTTVYNKLFYNSRGQLSEIRESTSWTGPTDYSWNRGAIINNYSESCSGMCGGTNSTTAMPDNNGNLRKQDVYIPNHDLIPTTDYSVRSQQYNYDKLNRLQWVRETYGGVDQWRQWFSYDRYGNRTIDTSAEPGDPHLRTWGGVNNTAFATFDLASKNRLYAPGDDALQDQSRRMQYDAVGNLKTDTYTGAGNRTYDAENKMTVAVGGVPTGQQLYKYDASGQRITRTVNGVESWAVYGFNGELVAEYPVNGVATSPQKEYGYRNGQLLITATPSAAGWGPAPTIDDNPLNPPGQPKTNIKAIHVTQLRIAINALRVHFNLPNYQWQKPTASGGAINNTVLISWEPINEMRTALDQALGAPAGGYAGGLAQNQLILAVHIQELRDRVLAAWQSGGTSVDIRWLVMDQLGTARIILDQSGSLTAISRHDYLPFGEELTAGVGGRTTAQGYTGSDGLRQRFTVYERDVETSLDYAQARYYASIQGRFTTPDQPFADQSADNPQSWNLYCYVRNNPLVMIDPTGRFGDYYWRDGTWAYSDQINDNKVYVLNQTTEADGSTNLTPQLLAITHTQFTIIANIIRQEAGTTNAGENLWIAHASNNEANATGTTLYALLQTGFSSAPASVKASGISTRDGSDRALVARAGVLDVLAGGADPTGGARRWDGTDFLAWGLNGPYGSHAKFREFASIHISGQIFSTYENAQIAKWGHSVSYSGTRYAIPAAVFTNAANWTQNRDFHYVTGARNQTRNLVATGAQGQTIFWRF